MKFLEKYLKFCTHSFEFYSFRKKFILLLFNNKIYEQFFCMYWIFMFDDGQGDAKLTQSDFRFLAVHDVVVLLTGSTVLKFVELAGAEKFQIFI